MSIKIKLETQDWDKMAAKQKSKMLRSVIQSQKAELEEFFAKGGSVPDFQRALHAVGINAHYNSILNSLRALEVKYTSDR